MNITAIDSTKLRNEEH